MADLTELANTVLGWAKTGESVEVIVTHSTDTEARAYGGEVESLSVAESQGVGVRVIADHRQGFASAGTFDLDVLAETLAEARDNVTFATPDEFIALAEPDGVAYQDFDLCDPLVAEMSTAAKIDLAIELEERVLSADPRISGIESAEWSDSIAETVVASTAGIHAHEREAGCFIAVYAMATEDDETQLGFGYSLGRTPGEISVDAAVADAVARATRLLGAAQPESEQLTVVLDPWVTAQFLGIIGSTLDGDSVLKGRSMFADRMGDLVAAKSITLVDDPTDAASFFATTADGEGLATRRNELITDGALQGFLHNSYTGRRSGTASTGSAARGYTSTPSVGAMALSLTPGTRTQAELIASVGDGVLISEVSGLHSGVNPVSGDFSTGAEGLRIRNGELAEPIREITIASTLQRMLTDVVEVGGDPTQLPMSATGVSLVVDRIMMSGK